MRAEEFWIVDLFTSEACHLTKRSEVARTPQGLDLNLTVGRMKKLVMIKKMYKFPNIFV